MPPPQRMQTRQLKKRADTDADLLKKFLQKNPGINISLPKVQLTSKFSAPKTGVPPQNKIVAVPKPAAPMPSLSNDQILKKFLAKNPNVKIDQKPVLKIPKMSPQSIARKKFVLKNPQLKLISPKVNVSQLPAAASAIDSLEKLQSHLERESKLRKKLVLHNIYYDVSHPAGYGSTYLLYKHAKKKLPSMKYKDVEEWLQKQRSHYLSKRVRKFQRRPVLVRGVQHQYQADLMDFKPLANHNNRRRYVLTVIDCFSRKATAVPLRSKKQTPVRNGLEKAFEELGYPKKLQTDQGKEFFNYQVHKFLRENNIAHFFTNQELKSQMVERFNRTLRDKIARYIFANDSWSFMKDLPQMIQSYNNKVHSSLKKFTPNQVNTSNEEEVRKILYKDYFAKKKNLHKYKIGDKVRAMIKRPYFKKMRHTFHEPVYTITDTLDTFPPTYHIKNTNNVAVEGAFYEKQLQPV